MEKSDIRKTRIAREKELLQKTQSLNYTIEFIQDCDSIEINTEVHGFPVSFLIDMPEKYPFHPPNVSLNQNNNLTTLTEFRTNQDILDQVLGESWLPVRNLVEVSDKLVLYAQQSFKPKDKALIIDIFSIKPYWSVVTVILVALLVRVSVIPFSHSGWRSRPFYGEYEKYRYWMEFTRLYPADLWYQSSDYWPVTNPPLNPGFCWVLSFISYYIDPNSLNGIESRGYVSAPHKLFMRITVIGLETLFFTSGVLTFFNIYYKNLTTGVKSAACAILLISPCLILVSHVQFSYNVLCIGMVLWSIIMIMQDYLVISAIFICIAINFKAESVVFLAPVVVGWVITVINKANKQKNTRVPSIRTMVFVAECGFGALSVLFSCLVMCALIWSPWLEIDTKFYEVINKIIEKPEYNYPMLPTLISLIKSFYGISDTYIRIVSYLAASLSITPFVALLAIKKPFGISLLYSLSGTSLSYYIFWYHEEANLIIYPLFPLSLLLIIDYPEVYRFISILFGLILYTTLIQDQVRSAYIFLSLLFFIISASYIKTINYLQNRTSISFKIWYIVMISIHFIEIIHYELFEVVINFFIFISLIGLWGWLLFSHFNLKQEVSQQYHVEKRFRKKNKMT